MEPRYYNYANRQELKLTDTLFKHRMVHRTAWESPINIENKENRWNPYCNQIDYYHHAYQKQRHRRRLALLQWNDDAHGPQTDDDQIKPEQNTRKKKPIQNTNLKKLRNPSSPQYAMNVEMKIMDSENSWDEKKHKTA